MSVLLLIGGLILFVGLVVVHEWGHFIAARRSGVEVEEFGIGFPPRAKVMTKKNGTIYTLNWLPLGGFVKLKGEHDADRSKGSFGATTTKNKIKIMVAGVGMNLLVAFLLLTLLALIGIPKLIDDQYTVARDTRTTRSNVFIGEVESNSPAQKTGLLPKDRINSIRVADIKCVNKDGSQINKNDCNLGSANVNNTEELQKLNELYNGKAVEISITRDGKALILTPTLRTKAQVESYNVAHHCNDENYKGDVSCEGYLGISTTDYLLQRSTWTAPVVAAGLIKQLTVLTFKGLGSAVKGLGSIMAGLVTGNRVARQHGQQLSTKQVSGPVGIFFLLKDGGILGYQFVLMVIAIISLTLAIMNILPIPALDGGRLFVLLLFRGLRKPLKQRTEDWIHGIGFMVLMVLVVLITIVDIKRHL